MAFSGSQWVRSTPYGHMQSISSWMAHVAVDSWQITTKKRRTLHHIATWILLAGDSRPPVGANAHRVCLAIIAVIYR